MSSDKHARRDGFKPKVIALSVAACFSLSAAQTLANPTGGTVVSGSASFANSGNTLTITNSANAIINWQNFSIGVNEITRFLQASGSSAVLNRVVGANGTIPQSVIDGVLSSNGRVFLLNPSGILIGSGARIDVAGFIASSLSLSDQDFQAGRMRFTETPGAGQVSNAGTIDTSSAGPGGRVWLVAPDVQNSGVIRTPQGEIILAAGKSVELVSESSPFVTVNITADSERALNVGQLLADSGRIGMFGALVQQSGVAQANSAVVGANGEIRLVATKDLTLDAGSVTTANGPGGGTVTLQAQGGTNLIYGAVEAKGSSGQGGTIEALGVRVGVLGHGVIDASGDTGGGTVLVGGDQHGANPNIQNAEQTLIGPDGVIRADAATTGDGGRVIVWSDAETRVLGSISARGGAQSGNGGFVETSSNGDLDVNSARITTLAPNGQSGTWLLDPTNVILEPNSYGTGDPLAYAATFGTNPGTTAHITEQTVETSFAANGTVKIQASNDVGFRTDLTLVYSGPSSPGLFEVRAVNNIDMAYGGTGAHTIISNGSVVLSANDVDGVAAAGLPALNTAYGSGSIIGGGNIRTDYGGAPGGDISLSGYGVSVGALETMGGVNRVQVGNITIVGLGGGVTTGTITTRGANGSDFVAGQLIPPTAGGNGGTINITAGYGSVSTGAIDASGGKGGNGGYASGQVFSGASGGLGGSVTIGTTSYGPVVSITTGSIKSTGGVGGLGGSGSSAYAYSSLIFDIAYGGDGGSGGVVSLSAGSVTTGAVDVSGGNAGAGGSNNSFTLYGGVNGAFSGSGDLFLSFGGNGGTGGQFFVNSNGFTGGSLTASGGAGGAGGSGNTGITIVNGAPATVTQATGSANVGDGGFGGSGGSISLNTMGPVNVAGSIITVGGVGGAGGAASKANASVYGATNASSVFGSAEAGLGGGGGGGGTVSTGGTTMTVNGAISTGGAAGGAGGNNSTAIAYASTLLAVSPFFQATADAGIGGDAGFSGGVTFTGGTISVGNINAAPAAAGAGGTGSSANVSGYGPTGTGLFLDTQYGSIGFQGSGGFVDLIGSTGVTTGSIDVSGARPGSVTIQSVSGDINTGPITARSLSPASQGGGVSLSTDTGRIVVNGNIDARGSDGLGVLIDTCNDGCIGFGYGGSGGGYVNIARTGQGDPAGGAPAIQVTGTIVVSGGDGFSPQGAAGGAGGAGGAVSVQGIYGGNGATYGAIVLGDIDAHGGSGGASAAGSNGAPGQNGGIVAIQGTTVSTGSINVGGGAGGAGGADAGNGAGYGGNGGAGGDVALFGANSVAAGNIDAGGGAGGNGGSSSLAGQGGTGGAGGTGGLVEAITNLLPGSQVTTGNVSVFGGRGGNGGSSAGGNGGAGGAGGGNGEFFVDPDSASIGAIAAFGGAGGAGGAGGVQGGAGGAGGTGADVSVSGIAYGGTIAVGNVDVSGGAGGAGGASGAANTYGGLGGAGGSGGFVDLFGGTLDLKAGGTLNAAGGAGGAGGSGVGAYGGNGGAGGTGGTGGGVDLFVPTQTAGVFGNILTIAPLNVTADGGAGGGGGATGGLSGTAGSSGTFAINGEVIIQATGQSLDANTVIQSTNQLALTNTAPSTEDLQKKNEDNKKKNQAAACK